MAEDFDIEAYLDAQIAATKEKKYICDLLCINDFMIESN
jgi:hypothetical protein